MAHTNPSIERLLARAQDCRQLGRDIDLIRPVTYETDPPMAKISELLDGAAALYELRFAALSEAYAASVREAEFFHYDIEECSMEWWRACDDLRCAAEGARNGLLDTDGLDNALLGIRSLALVRSERFVRLVEERSLDGAKVNASSQMEEPAPMPKGSEPDPSSW